MPTFRYKAIDTFGRQLIGVEEAETKDGLIKQLSDRGQFVTYIEEEKEIKRVTFGIFERLRGIKKEDVATFTTQLSTMLSAGLSISDSLRDIESQIENIKFKTVIRDINKKILEGAALSDALSFHKNIFPQLYINMVKAGEAGGVLPEVLNRLSNFYYQEIALIHRIKTAMTYPIVLAIVAICVIIFILINFIPKFVTLFTRMEIQLPLPTLILYKSSIILRKISIFVIFLILLLIWVFKNYIKTKQGKLYYDKLRLSLPIFGKLHLKIATVRFLRTLAILYSGGVPILEAITSAIDTMDNEVLSNTLNNVKNRISSGESISEPLKQTGLFQPMIIRMIDTGEKAGALDKMLIQAANFYDLEIDNTIERLQTLLEPIILVIMGIVVGLIMASTLMPMFQMIKLLRH